MTFLVCRVHSFIEIFADFLRIGILVQIKEALQPDGVFLGAILGGDSLFELRCAPFYNHSPHHLLTHYLSSAPPSSSPKLTAKAAYPRTSRP
jgi:hypothetical protein